MPGKPSAAHVLRRGRSGAPGIAVLLLLFAGGPARAHDTNLCSRSAENLFVACQQEKGDDAFVEIAKCNNLESGRVACRQEVLKGLPEDLGECGDQRDARLEICDGLGEDPYAPAIVPGDFVAVVDNPFFPLAPGTTLVYREQTADGTEIDTVTVTANTRRILGVDCIEVRDTSTVDGVVKEDTLDWFAQDRSGNVWYFGEESKQFEDGRLVSLEGSWLAGRDGAKPGIIMKAHPQTGDLYREEWSPGDAEDVAEVTGLHATVDVPSGHFTNCLTTENSAPLEPDVVEQKFYAPGIGSVLEIEGETGARLELIEVIHP